MGRALPLTAVLLAAASTHAQTVVSIDTLPAQPVATAPFVIRVTISGCVQFVSTSIDQTFVSIRVAPSTGCASSETLIPVNIGPLPAHSYFIQVSAPNPIGFSTVVVNGVAGVAFPVRLLVGCPAGQPPDHISNPSINGTNIDYHVTFLTGFGCIGTFRPAEFNPLVGPLAPGTYTIRIFAEDSTTPFQTQPLQVMADIPALDPRLLAMLAVVLIVLATMRLR